MAIIFENWEQTEPVPITTDQKVYVSLYRSSRPIRESNTVIGWVLQFEWVVLFLQKTNHGWVEKYPLLQIRFAATTIFSGGNPSYLEYRLLMKPDLKGFQLSDDHVALVLSAARRVALLAGQSA